MLSTRWNPIRICSRYTTVVFSTIANRLRRNTNGLQVHQKIAPKIMKRKDLRTLLATHLQISLIAIRSEVIRTHKAVLSLGELTRFIFASHSFFHCGPVGSLWKLAPFVLLLGLWRPTGGDAINHPEYFCIQDRGKFVKCDVISLTSITKIKIEAHCLKMASFWPLLRSSFSKTIHPWTKRIPQPWNCVDVLLFKVKVLWSEVSL